MNKSLGEMNEQEANAQFAQDYMALIQKYEAAGFQIQHIARLRRYVVMLLQDLEVPQEHLNADVVFAVVKNPLPPPEALVPPLVAANTNGHQKLAEEA
ncbi:MAG: hypothetical protein BroJett018_37650 [Chloroflexota bacterium]|nr:hypothetical protein [Chloroflexota bacterium]NOG64424.1 hypothetical protein [Chloroflexota bacterium]GIK65971.1 MAG: hypothetical protein BroJett018_37650 [Chloroflexota bacterium]